MYKYIVYGICWKFVVNCGICVLIARIVLFFVGFARFVGLWGLYDFCDLYDVVRFVGVVLFLQNLWDFVRFVGLGESVMIPGKPPWP